MYHTWDQIAILSFKLRQPDMLRESMEHRLPYSRAERKIDAGKPNRRISKYLVIDVDILTLNGSVSAE